MTRRPRSHRRFIDDLHATFSSFDLEAPIEFAAGGTQKQQTAGVIATVVAIAFFICLPFVLLMITRDTEALYPLIGGVIFIYPLMLGLHRNKPRSYRPRAVPDELRP